MNDAPLRASWLRTIAQVFAGSTVYAVGGIVRNCLMDLPISDVDLCGAARPDTVMKLCEGTQVRAKLRAAHFGTVELHVGKHMAEYTTFRKDSYRTGHQPVHVQFADTVEVDALRRDFTVNALYAPLDQPFTVIDPTGGLLHLQRHILHTVTNDPDQVLKDDGLRILRAIRFQAELGFTLTEAVLQSAEKYVGLLDDIVVERKHDELTKILQSDCKYPTLAHPRPPVSAALSALVQIGAWPKLFGALPPVSFVPLQNMHGFDVSAKFVLLYHQSTAEALQTQMRILRYDNHTVKVSAEALTVLQTIRNPKSQMADVLRFGLPALQKAAAVLKALADAEKRDLLAWKRAVEFLDQIVKYQLPCDIKALAIDGYQVLAFCRENGLPQTSIGRILTALWQAVVNQQILNTSDALLAYLQKHWIDSAIRE